MNLPGCDIQRISLDGFATECVIKIQQYDQMSSSVAKLSQSPQNPSTGAVNQHPKTVFYLALLGSNQEHVRNGYEVTGIFGELRYVKTQICLAA